MYKCPNAVHGCSGDINMVKHIGFVISADTIQKSRIQIQQNRRIDMNQLLNSSFILATMIFLHIIDDYCLQGILASMKQREWWKKNAPQSLYKNDYIIALITHAFSWSFCVCLPLAFVGTWSWVPIILNTIIHALIDDMKANQHMINLIQDQTIHILQIFVTWLYVVLV